MFDNIHKVLLLSFSPERHSRSVGFYLPPIFDICQFIQLLHQIFTSFLLELLQKIGLSAITPCAKC